MSQLSTGFPENDQDGRRCGPLVVRPARAAEMLSTSRQHVYDLLNAGELVSLKDGGARKITVKSIHEYIERGIAAARKQAA